MSESLLHINSTTKGGSQQKLSGNVPAKTKIKQEKCFLDETGTVSIKQELEQLDEEAMLSGASAFKSELLNCSVPLFNHGNVAQQQQPQQIFCHCESCDMSFADPSELEHHMLSGECQAVVSLAASAHPADDEAAAVSVPMAQNVENEEDGEDYDDDDDDYDEEREVEAALAQGSAGRSYHCLLCAKPFGTRASLLKHMLGHTSQRSLECAVCKKMFSQASYLKQHMLIHLGERPYTCHECGRTFTQSSTLKTHMFTHNSKVSPHQCPTCGKTFTRPCRLTSHILTHSRPNASHNSGLPVGEASSASGSKRRAQRPSIASARSSAAAASAAAAAVAAEKSSSTASRVKLAPRPPPRLLPKPPPQPQPHQSPPQQQQQQQIALQIVLRPQMSVGAPAKTEAIEEFDANVV